MNKSAIYATVKTVCHLIVPFAAGMAIVTVNDFFGMTWAAASFVPAMVFAVASTYVGDWILRKLKVPNY